MPTSPLPPAGIGDVSFYFIQALLLLVLTLWKQGFKL